MVLLYKNSINFFISMKKDEN